MKRLLLFFVAAIVSVGVWAAPVSQEKALRVATNFCMTHGPECYKNQAPELTDISAQGPYATFYTFALRDGGFVLVAADDCVVPILAYSFVREARFDDMPEHVSSWLASYEAQIADLRDRNVSPAAEVSEQWKALDNGRPVRDMVLTSISPLINTTWDQSPYYNILCPGSGSNRAVTGCVATAMAQVMKFWEHPATGRGSHSYVDNRYGQQSANFGATTYRWSEMPLSLGTSSTTSQDTAVATLMYHCGVAIEMDYDVDGSAAPMQCYGSVSTASAEQALMTYFRYQPTVHCITKADYTDAVWASMLRSELDAGRPILYEGSDPEAGHCFVCDGYDNNGRFHFNWGWSGYYDGYYTIGSLNLGGGGTGSTASYTFNIDNAALIGIMPMTNTTAATTTVSGSANSSSYGTVSGSGTYTNFADTVTLFARAREGYRFTQWSDGYKHNPRQFIAPGGTYSYVATFEPIAGDTITYSARAYKARSGTGGTMGWGMRIPSSSLQSGAQLVKVRFFVGSSGSYTVNIYKGSSTPSTQLHSQNVTVGGAYVGTWYEVTLSNPVAVDVSQSMWITLSTSITSYPACYTYCSGNPDGVWIKSGNSWVAALDYGFTLTWMIDGIFSDSSTPSTYTVSVVSNFTAGGTVTGSGSYAAGTTVRITATANPGYHFVQWNDGVTSATRDITVTGNVTYVAIFAADGGTVDECTITSLPWSESFESGLPSCWKLIDADGDGKNWKLNTESNFSYSGNNSMESDSWDNTDRAFQADNYLITPPIQLSNDNWQLTYYVRSGNTAYPDDMEVLVSYGDGNMASEFITLSPLVTINTSSLTRYVHSLYGYRGATIRLAFRHYFYDGLCLFLDDVAVESATGIADGESGLSLRCWTEGRTIVVSGAESRRVALYDVMGRLLESSTATENLRFNVMHPGVYMIAVEGLSAQRIVVM